MIQGRRYVLDVNENEWTARTDKAERWAWCRSRWPTFGAVWKDDEGGYDVSDATYLYEWCTRASNYYVAGDEAAMPPSSGA